MYELVIETPTGPETYKAGQDVAKAYAMMLGLICFMAVDAGSDRPEWQDELDDLCDAASLAPDDLEAEFVRAAWNDWARDFLAYGETQIRFGSTTPLRQVVGVSQRGVLGNYRLQLEAIDQTAAQEAAAGLRKISQDPRSAQAQQRPGVGGEIWMYPLEDLRIFYVIDDEMSSVVVIDVSPIHSVKLKTATLGEPSHVAYASS